MNQPYGQPSGSWQPSPPPGNQNYPEWTSIPATKQPQHRWGITIAVSVCTFVVGFGLGAIGSQPPVGTAASPAGAPVTSAAPAAASTRPPTQSATKATSEPVEESETPSSSDEDEASDEAPPREEPSQDEEEPEPKEAKRVTKREWAKVIKDPDAYIGDRFIIYGEVTQFDSATGKDALRADTAHKDTTEYGYFDGENTMMSGTAELLDDVVKDDVFKATVTVLGSYSYDTQIGGNTTVPQLQIDKITIIGNNE